MWKYLVALLALNVILIDAQDSIDFCVVCNQTSAEDRTCIDLEDPLEWKLQCERHIGTCFSRVDANGFIERGCGGDLANTTLCEGESCQLCPLTNPPTEIPCNARRFPEERLSCYICDGDQNSTCADLDRLSNVEHARLCPIFRNEDQCFSTRAGGNVTRGCASSIPAGRCNHGVCGFCRGENCNSAPFANLNGAFGVQTCIKLIAVAFAFLAFLSK